MNGKSFSRKKYVCQSRTRNIFHFIMKLGSGKARVWSGKYKAWIMRSFKEKKISKFFKKISKLRILQFWFDFPLAVNGEIENWKATNHLSIMKCSRWYEYWTRSRNISQQILPPTLTCVNELCCRKEGKASPFPLAYPLILACNRGAFKQGKRFHVRSNKSLSNQHQSHVYFPFPCICFSSRTYRFLSLHFKWWFGGNLLTRNKFNRHNSHEGYDHSWRWTARNWKA